VATDNGKSCRYFQAAIDFRLDSGKNCRYFSILSPNPAKKKNLAEKNSAIRVKIASGLEITAKAAVKPAKFANLLSH